MNDVNKIDDFLNALRRIWELVPDCRFGQLIKGVNDFYQREMNSNKDLFYADDYTMIEVLERYYDSFIGTPTRGYTEDKNIDPEWFFDRK